MKRLPRNILTNRLNDLVASGFLVKQVSPENKSKFLYDPTAKAVDLVPVLPELDCWSQKHTPSCMPNMAVGAFSDPKGTAMKNLRKRIVSQ